MYYQIPLLILGEDSIIATYHWELSAVRNLLEIIHSKPIAPF